jgi:molecular chaperone DnaK
MAASQALGEKVYAEAQAAQQAAGGAPGGAGPQEAPHAEAAGNRAAADDNVVDAEFKEVKKG